MTATTADYMWFEERFPDLAWAYAISLVHDLSPADLLQRLGGRYEGAVTGAGALTESAYDFYEPFVSERTLFGMATVDAWTLLVEPNGWLGTDEAKVLPASLGTCWVSHYDNGDANTDGCFLWAEHSELRLRFDLRNAGRRHGSGADELLNVIRRLGFEFPEEGTEADIDPVPAVPAAFALAEQLTGVRLTPDHLQDADFVCGSAPC
jgi:uncharacterized protein DUF6461